MEKLGKILIVDDNQDILFALNLLLAPRAEKVKVATSPDRIPQFMKSFGPDLVLLDMNFRRDAISGEEGFENLKGILELDPTAVVVMMTAYADTEKAVRAIKMGAADFIPKPWKNDKLLATLSAAMRLRRSQREVNELQQKVEALSAPQEAEPPMVIGQSPAMNEVLTLVDKLGQTDANILILGENGTGKDVIARLLAQNSPRAGKLFVSIDLGSVPESLFEGELFGYEKGAFTDARRAKAGRMEVASGGTLLLDEIGNLSLPMQAKLLTAIERREITRIGATHPTAIDIRLICATNADLGSLVADDASGRTSSTASTPWNCAFHRSGSAATTSSSWPNTSWSATDESTGKTFAASAARRKRNCSVTAGRAMSGNCNTPSSAPLSSAKDTRCALNISCYSPRPRRRRPCKR